MAQVAQPTFLLAIPSIHQKNPEFPAIFRDIDLDSRIQAGDQLDYAPVAESKSVAQALVAFQGEFKFQVEKTVCDHFQRSWSPRRGTTNYWSNNTECICPSNDGRDELYVFLLLTSIILIGPTYQ